MLKLNASILKCAIQPEVDVLFLAAVGVSGLVAPIRPRAYHESMAVVLFGPFSHCAGLARLGKRARDRHHHRPQRLLRQDGPGTM